MPTGTVGWRHCSDWAHLVICVVQAHTPRQGGWWLLLEGEEVDAAGRTLPQRPEDDCAECDTSQGDAPLLRTHWSEHHTTLKQLRLPTLSDVHPSIGCVSGACQVSE
eukprot:6832124-Alexandrium_andersonii.AAC.1